MVTPNFYVYRRIQNYRAMTYGTGAQVISTSVVPKPLHKIAELLNPKLYVTNNILTHICVTTDGGRVGKWIYLLTTYTHDSELQAITLLSLISTNHKLPQHPLSLFESSVISPAVSWQQMLTMEILQLPTLRSFLHRLPYRPDCQLSTNLVAPYLFYITLRHGPRRKQL
jgi:hypothetical protein